MIRGRHGLRWITGLAAGVVAAAISGHAALTTHHGEHGPSAVVAQGSQGGGRQ